MNENKEIENMHIFEMLAIDFKMSCKQFNQLEKQRTFLLIANLFILTIPLLYFSIISAIWGADKATIDAINTNISTIRFSLVLGYFILELYMATDAKCEILVIDINRVRTNLINQCIHLKKYEYANNFMAQYNLDQTNTIKGPIFCIISLYYTTSMLNFWGNSKASFAINAALSIVYFLMFLIYLIYRNYGIEKQYKTTSSKSFKEYMFG